MPIISLCSGYGGLDLVVESVTGERVVAYAEILPPAIRVLEARYPNAYNLGDITKARWVEVARRHPSVVLSVGFPCQDISPGGKRAGIGGSRSGIWKNVAESIAALKPEKVFLENVSDLQYRGIDVVEEDLAGLGYHLFWATVRASAVGACHRRNRWFGLALRCEEDQLPVTVRCARLPQDVLMPGLYGTPMVNSHYGAGDLDNPKNQSRLETQVVTAESDLLWVDRSAAVRRWEIITGTQAPESTNINHNRKVGLELSPKFAEWMMGLSAGWVTDVPGLNRVDQLMVIGGGVVPAQATAAFEYLIKTAEDTVTEKTAAVKAFEWESDLRHAPGPPEVVSGGFQSACRCGYPGKRVSSSPSHAYQATRVHAENENRREAGGGVIVQVENYGRSGEPPKTLRPRPVSVPGQGSSRASVGSSRASRAGTGTPCGCGCGESSGGLFRPGHDSKLLSRLLREIRSGVKTLADAHAEMVEIGTSEVLREKLAKKWGTAA